MNLQELKESLHLSKLSEGEIQELVSIGHQHHVDTDELLIENGTEGFSFFVLLSGPISICTSIANFYRVFQCAA